MNQQKTVLITGATRGLGKATAEQLAEKGYFVYVSGRNAVAVDAAVTKITAKGGGAAGLTIDMERPDTFAAAIDAIKSKSGYLDILINNAGVQLDGSWIGNSVAEVSQEVLRKTFQINFFGLVELTQLALPLFESSGHGVIVNVGTIMASHTLHADPDSPIAGTKPFAYDASKAALNTFTTHLAAQLREKGIMVNTAHPGWVKTDLGTKWAPMEIEDGVKTIIELATLESGGISGRFQHLGEDLPW